MTRGTASYDDMRIGDNECSQHICHVCDMFDSVTVCGGSVTVANNAAEPVECVGTVKAHIRDAENKLHELVLLDVLFLRGLRKNLISVTQLAQKGVEFYSHMFPGKVVLQRDGMCLISESQNGVCVLKSLNKAQFVLYVFP
ncbi:hypothetical protein GN958_ATG15722 [Phytophthora infestans]|uniref:Retrovirus-related Pol polyprotein from transposon TNT 1-94-like beta-barrel domain-containing protein n=1 Tax=Phytophthora infestans TaxID=4787 RepID=A0A8S9U5X8_PHYIN|nr:hypothetical protein GN958_ATG15722 [Phytophthora infestans]